MSRAMRKAVKVSAIAAASAYLLVGLAFGAGLKAALPAVSLPGAIHGGATWPFWIVAPGLLPLPRWCFDLDGRRP